MRVPRDLGRVSYIDGGRLAGLINPMRMSHSIRLITSYRDIIVDICYNMETGMTDFAHKAATTGSIYLEEVADYDLYCHYVAGLVGEGLSRTFSASGKGASWVGD
jgi:farnesyl-diphosphate farnesyltransferase